ncbi:SOS response-associated peptidase [Kocuria sp.]|uniref:SOS response-associated peptidase n=1 Tax=Kocuria sp. TaxID=1871328 RepID=UPI0026E0B124|nr:SOS response-associated peptidase [Kocuria sp.]MDO5617618.1 SOS response-associated peptidase [Kocuria sp.]
MCGRYVIARSVDDLLFDADAVAGAPLRKTATDQTRENWNVAPTTEVPILVERLAHNDDAATPGELLRELHVARWGLIPSWAKDTSIGARAFNARSETVMDKPMFRSAIRHQRCAVPANGYYEWKKRLDARDDPSTSGQDRPVKQPYYIHPTDPAENIWFAGIYEWWREPSGSWVLSVSILTTQAPPADSDQGNLAELGALHDRLPIALSRATLDDWLDPTVGEGNTPEAKQAVMDLVERVRAEAPAAAAGWQLRPVGAAVGNVRNNGPDLVEPVQALF